MGKVTVFGLAPDRTPAVRQDELVDFLDDDGRHRGAMFIMDVWREVHKAVRRRPEPHEAILEARAAAIAAVGAETRDPRRFGRVRCTLNDQAGPTTTVTAPDIADAKAALALLDELGDRIQSTLHDLRKAGNDTDKDGNDTPEKKLKLLDLRDRRIMDFLAVQIIRGGRPNYSAAKREFGTDEEKKQSRQRIRERIIDLRCPRTMTQLRDEFPEIFAETVRANARVEGKIHRENNFASAMA